MKTIELREDNQIKTVDILKITLSTAPQGVQFAEMRRRNKVLDAVEDAEKDNAPLNLEDADYSLVKGIVENFNFGVCNKSLENIIAGIVEA